jgi:predicted nuclease with TOPRIM domain
VRYPFSLSCPKTLKRLTSNRLEARHQIEQDRLQSASSELKEQNTRLREEVAGLTASKDDAVRNSQELQKRLDELAAVVSAVSAECQQRMQAQQEAMTVAANGAAQDLQGMKDELTNTVVSRCLLHPYCPHRTQS